MLCDYFIKRIHNCRYYYAENELCYLGYYLEHDLVKYEEYSIALIDNYYGSKIDRMYYTELSGNKTEVVTKKKIVRNEICPCGSGVKYKKCHGRQ